MAVLSLFKQKQKAMFADTNLTEGQRVNVTTIAREEWESKHQLFNGIVKEIIIDGPLTRIRVFVDELSYHSGSGFYNPIAGGGLFYLSAYNVEAFD